MKFRMHLLLALGVLLTLSLASATTGSQSVLPSTSDIYQAFESAVVLVETDKGQSAGFILDRSGRLATTFDVVDGATRATVRMSSGEVFDRIEGVAVDPRLNLAVLKIEGFDLASVRLGNSNSVEIRDAVIVLGISLGDRGFRPTLSEGIISDLRVEPEGFRAFAIEASLSAEDAGSPVLSRRGEVIGMVASPGPDGRSRSAIPINYLRALLGQ